MTCINGIDIGDKNMNHLKKIIYGLIVIIIAFVVFLIVAFPILASVEFNNNNWCYLYILHSVALCWYIGNDLNEEKYD